MVLAFEALTDHCSVSVSQIDTLQSTVSFQPESQGSPRGKV